MPNSQSFVCYIHYTKYLFPKICNSGFKLYIISGRAQFGPDLTDGMRVAGTAELAQPADGCSVIINRLAGKVAIVHRGNCMFVDKVMWFNSKSCIQEIRLF